MNTSTSLARSSLIISAFLLSACNSHIPLEIRQPVAGSPDIAAVRAATDKHISQKVRWGGIILSIENKANTSQVTLVSFPLNDQGEPQVSDQSSGRFIAEFKHFLEPLVYNKDRVLTVTGILSGAETFNVGEFAYEYPVIQVDNSYLWPVKVELDYNDYPYWWYDPYYPWHYPYPRHPYHLHR